MQRESAILVLTDLHYGKRTKTFDTAGFAARMDAFGERVIAIRERLSAGYHFDELVIPLLGDVNDGTGIYATQAHHQAETNVEEQAEQLTDVLAPWLRTQKKAWGRVRVECVPGNHGRAGRFAAEAANWDVVAYKYLRAKVKPDGIPVGLGRGNDNLFLRTIEVRKHRYLLYHGHEIHSFNSIPWYGMVQRIARWNTTQTLAPFDVVLMGHFHTFGSWAFNRINCYLSGTFVTDDSWALQCLGWESANRTWMFGVSDKRAVTWQVGVDL